MTEAHAPVVRFDDKGLPAPVEIAGTRIGFGTSERDESRKWAEVEIYRLHAGGYKVHRCGYSLVYHRADTWCRTRSGSPPGKPATVEDLPDEAEPCRDCNPAPPRKLEDGEEIRFEFPRHTFDTCLTPAEVVRALTVVRYRDQRAPTVKFSFPVQQALEQAAASDPEFEDVLR